MKAMIIDSITRKKHIFKIETKEDKKYLIKLIKEMIDDKTTFNLTCGSSELVDEVLKNANK